MPIDFTPDVDITGMVDGQLADAADVTTPIADLIAILNDVVNGDVAITPDIDGGTVDGATINNTGVGLTTPAGGTFNGLEARSYVALDTAAVNTDANFYVIADAGKNRQVLFCTNNSSGLRFAFLVNSVAESGSNAGSNFAIGRYSDLGAFIAFALQILRDTGAVLIENILAVDTNLLYVDGNNVMIGAYAAGASATNALLIQNGTAPTSSPANAIQLYATSGELRVRDSAGNITLLSPHGAKLFSTLARLTDYLHSEGNPQNGLYLELDIYGALEAVEQLTGKQFIYSKRLPPSQLENKFKSRVAEKRSRIRERMRGNHEAKQRSFAA